MEIHYVIGNVRTQLLEAGVMTYIVDMLRLGDDTAKIMSLRAINALVKYGARSILLDLICIITEPIFVCRRRTPDSH